MRLYSTSESAERGEITVLAVVETALCVTGSLFVAFYFETVSHIFVGACIAPFLLLRTTYSTDKALSWLSATNTEVENRLDALFEWWRRCIERVPILFPIFVIPRLLVSFITLAVLIVICKAGATAWSFVRDPLGSLRAVPANWRCLTLSVDSLRPPEPLPGLIRAKANSWDPQLASLLDWNELVSQWKRVAAGVDPRRRWPAFVGVGLSYSFVLLIIHAPALLYRYSLKATSVIYLPFLFLIWWFLFDPPRARDRVEDLRVGKAARVVKWYSLAVVAVTAIGLLTPLLPSLRASLVSLLGSDVDSDLVRVFAAVYYPSFGPHYSIKLWQVAQLANALLFLWLSVIYADKSHRRLASGSWQEDQVERALTRVAVAQTILTLYTTGCSLIIFGRYLLHATIPPVGFEAVP